MYGHAESNLNNGEAFRRMFKTYEGNMQRQLFETVFMMEEVYCIVILYCNSVRSRAYTILLNAQFIINAQLIHAREFQQTMWNISIRLYTHKVI